jgi:hypothetical protein
VIQTEKILDALIHLENDYQIHVDEIKFLADNLYGKPMTSLYSLIKRIGINMDDLTKVFVESDISLISKSMSRNVFTFVQWDDFNKKMLTAIKRITPNLDKVRIEIDGYNLNIKIIEDEFTLKNLGRLQNLCKHLNKFYDSNGLSVSPTFNPDSNHRIDIYIRDSFYKGDRQEIRDFFSDISEGAFDIVEVYKNPGDINNSFLNESEKRNLIARVEPKEFSIYAN